MGTAWRALQLGHRSSHEARSMTHERRRPSQHSPAHMLVATIVKPLVRMSRSSDSEAIDWASTTARRRRVGRQGCSLIAPTVTGSARTRRLHGAAVGISCGTACALASWRGRVPSCGRLDGRGARGRSARYAFPAHGRCPELAPTGGADVGEEAEEAGQGVGGGPGHHQVDEEGARCMGEARAQAGARVGRDRTEWSSGVFHVWCAAWGLRGALRRPRSLPRAVPLQGSMGEHGVQGPHGLRAPPERDRLVMK